MGPLKTVALFIHSTGTLPSMWDGVPREAFGEVEVLAPANLGYPPNPPLIKPAAFTLDDEVQHLWRKIPPGARVHLFAHSYGGLVGLKLVPLLGERLQSMLLFDPVLFGALRRSRTASPEAVTQANSFLTNPAFLTEATGGDEPWLATFIDYWNRPGSWERLSEPLKQYTRSVSWKMFREVREVFLDGSAFEDHVVRAPLTLLTAERSPLAARAMIDALAGVNPHAVRRELQGTGHMAPLTHPALLGAAVLEHWQRVRP